VKATRKTPVGPTDVGLRRPVLQAEHYVQIHLRYLICDS